MDEIKKAITLIESYRAADYYLNTETTELIKTNNELCSALALELYKSYTSKDRALIRFILENEILMTEKSSGVPFSLKACVIMLFKIGEVEDSIIIWKAKTCNFDTLSSIDVQLMAGGGIEETISFLEGSDEIQDLTKVIQQSAPDSTISKEFSILQWLNSCYKNGELKDLEYDIECITDRFEDNLEDYLSEK